VRAPFILIVSPSRSDCPLGLAGAATLKAGRSVLRRSRYHPKGIASPVGRSEHSEIKNKKAAVATREGIKLN
jgi:hypothetical protein